MADLQALRKFAGENAFDLTRPLTARQARELAEYWLPDLHFHEDERFHPIALADVFDMVESHLASMPPEVREQWRVGIRQRGVDENGSEIAETVLHDPPVLFNPDGSVGAPGPKVRRVLAEGAAVRAALGNADVNTDTFLTNGPSFTYANEHFGATDLLFGGNNAVPGNPWMPRADEPVPDGNPGERRPRMTVLAQYVNLLDVLEYEVRIAEMDADQDETTEPYPPDAMRRAFGIGAAVLVHNPALDPTTPPLRDFEIEKQRRDLLLEMIVAHEGNAPLPTLPPGWELQDQVWRVVTDHAFLEYTFFYAYNDFERWQTAIFDNEHEGDDEGCCLVFHRRDINVAAQGDIRAARPFAIITSVHEEYMDADLLRRIPPPETPGPLGRDGVDLKVFIAGGSHATYLDPGTHDLVDYQDYWGFVDENDIWYLAPLVLPISIILAILEHFIDTEDFTSEEGVHGGPGVDAADPTGVATHVLSLPMSANRHIYDGNHDDLLALRAYPGKWGGDDGIVDKSPPFPPKTKRYLNKLFDSL
jgi:hypothetical protein